MADDIRALIVDDEPLTGKVLRDILEPRNCACVTASNTSCALEMLSRHCFDLVLLDIMLPGESGLELLDNIKISQPTLPVVMVTALNDAATAVQAMKKGATDYLVKPFSLDDVHRCLDTVLKENSPQVPLTTRPAASRMEVIAEGVEVMVDHFDFHERIVTERTIAAAKRLAIPETDIQAWAATRREANAEREKQIGLVSGLFNR